MKRENIKTSSTYKKKIENNELDMSTDAGEINPLLPKKKWKRESEIRLRITLASAQELQADNATSFLSLCFWKW